VKRLSILSARAVGIGLLMGVIACTSAATNPHFDYCDPAIPADECYSMRRDPDSPQVAQAIAIARRYIEGHPIEEEIWDWKSGVWMFALTELYRVTRESDLHDYYQSWLDYWIEQGYRIAWSDSCPPAITAVALLNEKSTDTYQQVVDDTLEYLDVTAPRTEAGGISHNGTYGHGKPFVWLDSLFMFGMVLNRWGDLADTARLDMMSEQVQIFADALQDDNGFMRHAQDWPGYDESVYWARGNGWVVASLSDYLRARVEQDATDPEVEQVFRNHIRAIIGAQQSSGLWLSVMSHPEESDNYLETSASALFAYGIARAYRYGILGEDERKVAQAAVKGIEQRISDGSIVTGVSLATDPWPLQQYLDVPIADDVNYGVGAVILALLETSGLPE
jgi:unsaturated rhamnogalacturonyl hydrolase